MTADDVALHAMLHAQARANLWSSVIAGPAIRMGGNDLAALIAWADHCLQEFDARFPAPAAAGQ